MELIWLRSESIGALALFTLCFFVLMYLLSIRNKSGDGWRITILFTLFLFDHLAGFIGNSLTGIWFDRIIELQDILFAITIIYQIWFIYRYKQNPFERETPIALLLFIFLYGMALYFQPQIFFWTSLLGLLSYLWIQVILYRKIVITSIAIEKLEVANQKNTLPLGSMTLQIWIKTLVQEFKYPANRTIKAYRSFAWWNIANIATFINIALMVTNHSYNIDYWVLVHLALILIALIWLIIAYMNNAEEQTTFLAKIVGLVLCFTLLLLGILGALLYGRGTASGVVGEQQQKGLKTLALLIPIASFFIIVMIPLFLRHNLLKPLNNVLEGVKHVNAGNLSKDVEVEVNDELGHLAQNFNQMTESLRGYTNQMEGLVAQRTIELQNQKEELQIALENLKATQAQLIQSEKMASLGELTAGIAHEIQNPLNFVNNFSEVNKELIAEIKEEIEKRNYEEVKALAKDVEDNEEKINHHGKRADAIVKGMLQHSQTSTGLKEPTDINKLAVEYLRLAYHGLRAKDKSFNSEMKTDFDESIGYISIIPQDIGRVLLNLYNNAFYAVNEKRQNAAGCEPTVSVSTKKIGDKVEIKVADNGNGIPQKLVDKIFQPFFTTKPAGQGTGLGLSLSYDIIKAHGGEIKATSTENENAEFIIVLPIKND